MTSSTFATNTGTGPDIDQQSGSVQVAGDLFGAGCSGTPFTDLGHNAATNLSCLNAGSGDVTTVLPTEFSGPENNGGPTPTVLPLSPSPAIGLIPSGTQAAGIGPLCPTTDQRGTTTATGVACNAGAVQASGSVHSAGAFLASTPDGNGFWLATANGGVFPFGDATGHGSVISEHIHLNQPIVGIAATPDGKGYWLVASDGGIFTFGDAGFHGSAGSIRLNQPIVAMTSTPDGKGYYLVATDGGIFTYGDAKFRGSLGNITLNQPIFGMTATPDNLGYYLVAKDGGVFTFGDAHFHGSAANDHLLTPAIGIAVNSANTGYWLLEADGQVFNFGAAKFFGEPGFEPAVGLITAPDGLGYTVVNGAGAPAPFGG